MDDAMISSIFLQLLSVARIEKAIMHIGQTQAVHHEENSVHLAGIRTAIMQQIITHSPSVEQQTSVYLPSLCTHPVRFYTLCHWVAYIETPPDSQ